MIGQPQVYAALERMGIGFDYYESLDLTARPAATCLLTLTLTTADGHPHALRLLEQSDVFGR